MSGDTAMLQIGGIEILIGGDPSQLSAATKKIKSAFDEMQKGGISAFGALNLKAIAAAAGITTAFYKVVAAIKETITAADEMGKTAQRLGVGVDPLTRLAAAADKAGVSTADLAASLKYLTLQMQQPADSDSGRTFAALGISIRDAKGQMRDAIDVFDQVANAMARYRDGANKTTIAIQLLGRNGQQFIPFMNQGADAIAAVGDSAAKTGVAMDRELIEKASKFNDTWKSVGDVLQKAINTILKSFLPALTQMGQNFVDAMNKGTAFEDTMKYITRALQIVTTVIDTTWTALKSLVTVFVTGISAIYSAATGDLKAAYETMSKGAQDIRSDYEATGKTLKQVWGVDVPKAVAEGADALNKATSGKANAPRLVGADEIARQVQIIRDTAKDLPSELAALQKVLGINGDVINQNTAAWQQYNAAATAAAQAAQVIGQMNLQDILDSEGLRTSTEKMNALNDAVHRGAIGWRQYGQMAKAVADLNEQNMNSVLTTTANTLNQVFQKSKTAAIAAALINTYQGITAALKVDPPYGFILAGLVAAQGFAQVANIRNTSQTGGGGNSSSAASAAAAPVAPVAAAATQTLNVVGIDRNSLFSGDAVRDLAQRLVEFQEDGGKVVIA